jgi:hypothetical protein
MRAGAGFLRGHDHSKSAATMHRDFSDRSATLSLAKKSIRPAMGARLAHQSALMHEAVEPSAIVEEARQTIRVARQGRGEEHETRWRARSTLLLLVSAATLFWGTVFWILLG